MVDEANNTDCRNQLDFGPVSISWHRAVKWPIAVDHDLLNGAITLITVCDVTYTRRGLNQAIIVPHGFAFDGASIPRICWWIPGFSPLGKHLWAALIHDWLCVESAADRFDRNIADAIFAAVLEHTQVPGWRGRVMDLAVNGFRRYLRIRRSWEMWT